MKPLAWLAWLGLPFKGLYLQELELEPLHVVSRECYDP